MIIISRKQKPIERSLLLFSIHYNHISRRNHSNVNVMFMLFHFDIIRYRNEKADGAKIRMNEILETRLTKRTEKCSR